MRIRVLLPLAALPALAALLAAGCSGDTGGTGAAAPDGTTASGGLSASRTAAASPTPAGVPRPTRTPAPVTVDAPCPYADAGTIAGTVGQRIARSTVTKTSPHVGCAFYRPNGEKAADIAVSVLDSAVAAQAEAVRLPGGAANPVDSVADGGAVAITDSGALLAVSRGAALVVVRINQRSSLEAVEIARLVVAKL